MLYLVSESTHNAPFFRWDMSTEIYPPISRCGGMINNRWVIVLNRRPYVSLIGQAENYVWRTRFIKSFFDELIIVAFENGKPKILMSQNSGTSINFRYFTHSIVS